MKNLNHTQKSRRYSFIKIIPVRALSFFGNKGFRGLNHFTCLAIIAVLFVAAATPLSIGQDNKQITAAEARKIIAEGNRQWGKARVEFDKETFEKMLAPEFYVQLPNRKLSRKQFINVISYQQPGVKLSRFDATVLTVSRAADGWVAVIHEKLELETATGKIYSLWITRDGWKKVDNQWFITFSEAIGSEDWRGGEKPPFSDW